jgi:hypothetical protein
MLTFERNPKAAKPGSVEQSSTINRALASTISRACAGDACNAYASHEAYTTHDAVAGAEQTASRGGAPLSVDVRGYFEPRFGQDFSRVRIHADGEAAVSARSVWARAFSLGDHIVMGEGEYRPDTQRGKRLLAHELAHVVQQRGGSQAPKDRFTVAGQARAQPAATPPCASGSGVPVGAAPHALARAKLDVAAISQVIEEAASVAPSEQDTFLGKIRRVGPQLIGHQHGEIAFAADYPGGVKPALDAKGNFVDKSGKPVGVPSPDGAPVPVDANLPIEAHFFPSARAQAKERALILGGFHGNEHPGWEVPEALIAELSALPGQVGGHPLYFHTMIVPRVNAGSIADELSGGHPGKNRYRCNRQIVDLNRDFPVHAEVGATNCVNTSKAPRQPEVTGVIELIRDFKPDRILTTHAISEELQAGVFSDPNIKQTGGAAPGKVEEAEDLARGMARTLVDSSNRPANELHGSHFNAVYPLDRGNKISGGPTLGAYGPATSTHPPVITMEAPGFRPLAEHGERSKDAFLQPAHAFLTDPALLDTLPDEAILRDIDSFTVAERVAFLTGRLQLAEAIYARIRERVDIAVAKLNSLSPPKKIELRSGLRTFGQPQRGAADGSSQANIVYKKFFMRGQSDLESVPTSFFIDGVRTKGIDRAKWLVAPSADRLAIILKFSALPGASRHHWGTDVDFNSVESADWAPGVPGGSAAGPLFEMGVWLQGNAARAGFVQPYTPGRTAGYNEEPWHYSYAPLAVGLRTRYHADVNLSTDVADAFLDYMKRRAASNHETVPPDLDAAVKALKISDFVDNIGPGL